MKKRGLLLLLCIFLLIPLTTSAATNSKTMYFYDSNGRIIRQEITNPDQIVLYRYDTKGRLLSRKVDRAYPTIPVVSLVNVDAFYINVKWTPSSDDLGLEGYEYQVTPGYRTGLISSNLTSLKLDGLEPNTSYSIRVRSKDIAGRYSAYQSISAKTWPADPGKPSTPTSFNYTINGSSANLSWGASFDPYGIKEYGIRLDGVEIARTQLLSYTLTNLTYEQMHTIHVYSVNIRGAAVVLSPQGRQ